MPAPLDDGVFPRRPFIPTVVDVAAAVTCPRIPLLKLVYGASGEYTAGLAIGTVTHSVLAELGRIESNITEKVDRTASVTNIAEQIYALWLEEAETKINESWRIFADAKISVREGMMAVLQNLRGFSGHLAREIQAGYQPPDAIITGHHIVDPELPLEGVPDEYRIFRNPLQIEIREFKSYGGKNVNETNKLQACGYQLLLERLYPDAEFTIRVYSRDDVVNVRLTDSRRSKLYAGIEAIKEVYEHARGPAKPIPQICAVCGVNQACTYYFNDIQPQHVRRYLWRLRMETLEEKGLNQAWKWRNKHLPKSTRIELGLTDEQYTIKEIEPEKISLTKNGMPNVLPGDTVIVSGGDPLTTPGFTGEVSEIDANTVTVVPYGDLPVGLPTHNLVLDLYNVDLTRRQLRSIDTVHRAEGRSGELARRLLGVEAPRNSTTLNKVEFIGNLNPTQQDAVRIALSAPDYAVILGPPGTGKTLTIIELLTQLAREGKRALAVSTSNSAVDNLVERLLNEGYRFQIRFGNWFKIRERAMEVSLINIVTGEEDLALAAVEKMRKAAAILTTCSSASMDLVRSGHFDVVIFEESSQIRMQDAFAALTQGDKAIIIGDDKQLPPVSRTNKPINSLLQVARSTINRYNLQSDLVRDLRIQYRMRREICNLINSAFYENRLESDSSVSIRRLTPFNLGPIKPSQLNEILKQEVAIGVIDVEGVEEYRGTSTYNRANLEVDMRLLDAFKSAGVKEDRIGLITPYKEQQRILARTVRKENVVGTVDSFQGQERDIIILDMVRANPHAEVGFTLQPNRLNVALSRAREKLIIVTNLATYQRHREFSEIIDRIRNMPNTCITHLTASDLDVTLPTYRKREDFQVKLDMSTIEEPNESPVPITPPGDYFEVA